MNAKLSLLSLSNAFLDPLLIILTLLAVATQAGENFNRNYFVLSLIAFSLSFPGVPRHDKTLRAAALDIILGWSGIAAILFFFAYVSEYLDAFPRQVILAWAALTPVTLFFGHCLLRHSMRHSLQGESKRKMAVIAGMGELGIRLAREIQSSPYLGIELAGFVDDRCATRLGTVDGLPLLGRIDGLSNYARANSLDVIYIALPMVTQPRILRLLDD